jgi:glycosyltransferase involved in cell wall biosynthesis
MKILLTSASFRPSYGGPAYSVRSLAEHLSTIGHEIAIWAPDGSAVLEASSGGRCSDLGDSTLGYTGRLSDVLSNFGLPDIFHDSGLWLPHNHAISRRARLAKRPVVVSVRGMLEPAALRHRSWKKRLAWHLYQRRNLEAAAALHVTGDLEAQNVGTLGLRSRIVCIPNGIEVPAGPRELRPTRQRKLVFLGRMHPIKGLPMLLEAWSRVQPVGWTLEISGPDENGHRKVLETIIAAQGLAGSVVLRGPVRGQEKTSFLKEASIFVLPSHSENFGVAAGEALAAGVPVIATKGTPWSALEVENCGWYVETSVKGIEGGLRRALALTQGELMEMGRRGRAYVERAFSWDRVAEDMEALYRSILS